MPDIELAKLQSLLDIYKKRCEALSKLVNCYRYKKRITEKLMDELDATAMKIPRE